MSSNFTIYGRKADPMNIADLEVGQTLVEAEFGRGVWRETKWTIAKLLKTRLVLTSTYNRHTREGVVAQVVTKRMLVTQDKYWDDACGRVQTNAEGDGTYARQTYLWTENDPALAELRDEYRAAAILQTAKNKAHAATSVLRGGLTIEAAHEAIVALEAYINLAEAAN